MATKKQATKKRSAKAKLARIESARLLKVEKLEAERVRIHAEFVIKHPQELPSDPLPTEPLEFNDPVEERQMLVEAGREEETAAGDPAIAKRNWTRWISWIWED